MTHSELISDTFAQNCECAFHRPTMSFYKYCSIELFETKHSTMITADLFMTFWRKCNKYVLTFTEFLFRNNISGRTSTTVSKISINFLFDEIQQIFLSQKNITGIFFEAFHIMHNPMIDAPYIAVTVLSI